MDAAPEAATPGPPFRLETFGTPTLLGPAQRAGAPDQGPPRRRLALLAVLAAAGERGRTRDHLLGLFWPDVDQSHARHALEQLVYAIRTSVHPSLFAGVNPLRLDPAVISSDVADFERALAQGQLEKAVEQYHGHFLEGFYLEDAPEFERWLDAERARLQGRYEDTLEQLARAGEAQDDPVAVVRWRRLLTACDPLNSNNAASLMRALVDTGDHVAALRYAEQYEALVAQELQTSVAPGIAALVAEIRAGHIAAPPAPRRTLREHPPIVGDTAATASVASAAPSSDAQMRRPVAVRTLPITPTILRYGGAALLLAAVAFGVVQLQSARRDRPATGTREPSIAVLPLTDRSIGALDATLADGMTEELIAMLAKLGGLRVIASTSVFAFRDRAIDVRRIADSLHVSHVLEGALQRDGPRLRVQVRLIDARDGSTRWSETYDRELQDVFSVQDDIARAVARELDLRLAGGSRAPSLRHQTRNIAAYELYLRGRDLTLLRSDSATRVGLEYFRQAIALDSTYAAAYAGVAHMYVVLAIGASPRMPLHELHVRAEAAARKALALDDSLAEAHAALGFVRSVQFDFASAEAEFKRAIALDPLSRAREFLAVLYIWTGRPVEALAEARRALDANPLSPTASATLAEALFANGRDDDALAQLEHTGAIRPELRRTPRLAGQYYARKGMWPEAIAVLRPAAERGELRAKALLGYTLARAGQRAETSQILDDLLSRWRRNDAGAFPIAVVYAGLRDFDQAFVWLEKAIEDRSLQPEIMLPTFEDLHADPRFERLRRRMGLPKR